VPLYRDDRAAGVALISEPERQRLAALEREIAPNLQAFITTGKALAEIRDRRLYRESCTSFGHYCEARWGLSRAHANRLIDAAETAKMLPSAEKIHAEGLKLNERLVRELNELRKSRPELVAQTFETVVRALPNATHREMRRAVSAVLRTPAAKGGVAEAIQSAIATGHGRSEPGLPLASCPACQKQRRLCAEHRRQHKRTRALMHALQAIAELPQPSTVASWMTPKDRAEIERLCERALAWCKSLRQAAG
jgi:hypothetical protein